MSDAEKSHTTDKVRSDDYRKILLAGFIIIVIAGVFFVFFIKDGVTLDFLIDTGSFLYSLTINILSVCISLLFTYTILKNIRRADKNDEAKNIADGIEEIIQSYITQEVETRISDYKGVSHVLIGRDEPSMGKLLEGAKSRIWLLNWWDPQLNSYIEPLCIASKNSSLDIRICLQDPDFELHRGFSLDNVINNGLKRVKNGIEGNLRLLEGRRKRFLNYNLRLFRTCITAPILIVDDTIIFGLFLHYTESPEGPQFIVHATSGLGGFLVDEFKNVWEDRSVKEYDTTDWILKEIKNQNIDISTVRL